VFWKDRESNFLGCNLAFARDAGLSSPDELVGRDDFQMGWREQAELYRADDRQVMETGEPRLGFEEPQTTPDGGRIWLRTSKVPLRDETGAVVGVLGTYEDITASKRAEEKRVQLEEQLGQTHKLEAIGRLAGGVAHDFNNLLTVILGSTGLVLEGLGEGHPLSGDLHDVLQAGQRAAELTRQLLAFSRKQVLQPEPLDLNRLVSDMERMLRRIIGEDIDLTMALAPELGPTRADPGQLEQAIMNLAVNARDAMPGGGRLTLETAEVELDASYANRHGEVQPGPFVMLAVTDTGCGMDAETQARLFEPFFTTKGPGQGTGLGLSSVYGLVQQSGGHIWVYSEPGQGTTFKLYLPRASEAPTVAPRAARPMPHAARGRETVLVVEDELVVRNLVQRILEAAGYAVLCAPDGQAALELAGRHPGEIHLVLTDVVMPRLSGRALVAELSRARPDLRALYMSGYTDNAIVHHGVLDPGTQFIGKPFTATELCHKIRQILDEA
jgi:PAS domain S-box-containing protein